MSDFPRKHILTDRKILLFSRFFLQICLCWIIFSFSSCRKVYTPKPTAYPRISYPKTNNIKTEGLPFPVTFEYPDFIKLDIPTRIDKQQKWANLHFIPYQAILYTGFLTCDSEEKIKEHFIKNESSLIKENAPYTPIHKEVFISRDSTVTGFLYEIAGNTANPIQFMLTDKHQQIFRGSLYFNYKPNRDSIKDILDGITIDIRNIMESVRFKQ